MTAVDTEPLAWDPLDEKYKVDPHPIWKRLRDEAPLYYNDAARLLRREPLRRRGRLQPRPADVLLLARHGDGDDRPPSRPTMEIMIFMDPPDHTRYRRLVSKAFTPRRMALLEDDIRQLCASLLDAQVGKSSFDYVQDFGARVPAYVIAALLGVPPEDRDMVRGWIDESFHLDPELGMYNDVSAEAMGKLMEYVTAQVADRQTLTAGRHVHGPAERRDRRRGRRAAPAHDGAGGELRPPDRQRRDRDGGPAPRLGGTDPGRQPGPAGRAGRRRRA